MIHLTTNTVHDEPHALTVLIDARRAQLLWHTAAPAGSFLNQEDRFESLDGGPTLDEQGDDRHLDRRCVHVVRQRVGGHDAQRLRDELRLQQPPPVGRGLRPELARWVRRPDLAAARDVPLTEQSGGWSARPGSRRDRLRNARRGRAPVRSPPPFTYALRRARW